MKLTEDRQHARSHANTIKKWHKFTKDLREKVYYRFEGAVSSFETDESHYSLSFVLYGYNCSMKLTTDLDRYFFHYRIQLPNETYMTELIEGDSQLKFESSIAGDHELHLSESDSESYNETFDNLFDIFKILVSKYSINNRPLLVS